MDDGPCELCMLGAAFAYSIRNGFTSSARQMYKGFECWHVLWPLRALHSEALFEVHVGKG